MAGVSDVAAAVVASTLTTVAVFAPIAFVEGIGGELFGDLSIAVVGSLVASLAVTLFLVPTLAALDVSSAFDHNVGTLEGRTSADELSAVMRSLEQNLVDKSLRLPVLVRQRANTAALLEKLRLVHAVWATQPTIQQLLTARDFPGALELIASSQQLLTTGAADS